MGVLQTLLDKAGQMVMPERVNNKRSKSSSSSGNTADDILEDPSEVERLSKYIDPSELKKIINLNSGIKHGVDQIGSTGDTNNVLKSLLRGASSSSKRFAAKILVNKWAEQNLTETLITKTGKEILGKAISKNIYIKQVKYTVGKGKFAGRVVSYLQARNIKTGRVVSYHGAMSLLGKMS